VEIPWVNNAIILPQLTPPVCGKELQFVPADGHPKICTKDDPGRCMDSSLPLLFWQHAQGMA
jgi:hypothetical protein